jgi:hypothetical protein
VVIVAARQSFRRLWGGADEQPLASGFDEAAQGHLAKAAAGANLPDGDQRFRRHMLRIALSADGSTLVV